MDTLQGAALAFILCIGPCYAADKIALICSDAKGKDDYSLSIDLDRKLASFHMSDLPDADGIPITGVSENYIWFQYKALPAFIRKGSWIESPDRSTFFSGSSTAPKTII